MRVNTFIIGLVMALGLASAKDFVIDETKNVPEYSTATISIGDNLIVNIKENALTGFMWHPISD
jgi:hypothetical protein